MNPDDGFGHWILCSEKIIPYHLERLAVIYVRQSTAQQILDHRESTRLHYGLVARAQELGWPKEHGLTPLGLTPYFPPPTKEGCQR
jgi:hypothetical protein